MKKQILLSLVMLTIQNAAQAEYRCVLENKPLKQSPLIIVQDAEEGGPSQKIVIYKNKDTYDKVLEVTAKDLTEDVLAQFENKREGFALSFYMDEADGLGMSEGSIKSAVANGDLRCLYSE